jgi:fermentation-respiration switch protein FrsA (DUF1100 family)
MRALILTLVLCATGCTPAFFQPSNAIYSTPGQYGLEYEPVEMRATDGTELFAWFMPARGAARATVLFLHGNAENISTHFANVAWLPARGFNVLALDYRGYGGSQGTPTLSGIQLDIDAAMRTLLARRDVDPQRIIVFGQSLGAALAVHYVANSPYRSSVRAVVLDSPFSDYQLIVREKLAGFFLTWPFQWITRMTVENDYSPAASIEALAPIPVLFIHGKEDLVVPPHHSQRLYERAREPKQLWVVPDTGHIQAVRNREFRDRLARFLERHSSDSAAVGGSAPM